MLVPKPVLCRVMVTALSTLALLGLAGCAEKVASPVVEQSQDPFANPPAAARLYGVHSVDLAGQPLGGTRVSIEANRSEYSSVSNAQGWAYITIPDDVALPSRTIMVVDNPGKAPVAFFVNGNPTTRQRGDIQSPAIVGQPLVRDPRLHHIGDDSYSGSVNSQLQKPSEGSSLRYTFELAGQTGTMPKLRVFGRGLNIPMPILINGVRIGSLPESDVSGGLTLYQGVLPGDPAALLRPGTNTITFVSTASPGSADIDDIETCGLVISL